MGANTDKPYDSLVKTIAETYSRGRVNSFKAVNSVLVTTYWRIGQHIVEFEQGGNTKAVYGDKLLERLSKDLSLQFGKGFSRSNLTYMRAFFVTYPISEKPSHKLGDDKKTNPDATWFDTDRISAITAKLSDKLSWSLT